ncbi:MAG: ade [Ignavibacteria bacterium]|nr:ade [Ignavibacteria bacterium]
MNTFTISGNIVDIIGKKITPGTISIVNGFIESVIYDNTSNKQFIMPGFIDSHIHIESSMLAPSEFAKIAVTHGTIAAVADPHEIANVMGMQGIEFMIENGETTPFQFFFGAPSCVPATPFETAGATITVDNIKELLENPKIKFLSEMMNFPGVIYDNSDVIAKLNIAKAARKPIDGHAPGLRGDALRKYISAGISTDHESMTLDKALEKISLGMKVLIREGSAAKNFSSLNSLIDTHNDMVMLCSDDKHPDDLSVGHINLLIKQALLVGHDLFNILRCAIFNPIKHYNLNIGMVQSGDRADFVVVDDLQNFNIKETFIKGEKVAENGKSLIESTNIRLINNFNTKEKTIEDFRIESKSSKIRVIGAIDGQLITESIIADCTIENGNLISNTETDILKIAVVNRYSIAPPSIGFIKNFGLKSGAIASSVAHDSHNIIAVGTSDREICIAINAIIRTKGGMAIYSDSVQKILPLPIAGLMSNEDCATVGKKYSELTQAAKSLGCTLHAPFMTLSFMALPVIPHLKLTDKGLFDVGKFEFTSLFV